MRLPTHDRTTLVHPDAMHTITTVVTTLAGLLSGNGNISQVLLEEEEFGQREWYRDVQTVKGMDINIFVGFLNHLSLVFIYIFLETLCSALKLS